MLTDAKVVGARDDVLELEGRDGTTAQVEIGDFLITAIGPAPDAEGARACADAGVDYVVVGDASKPGDFLSCLRDASMVALSVDQRFRQSVKEAA